MPAAAIASIALVSVLPGPGAVALVAIQMIGSANPVIDLYDTRHDWRLRGIPLRAALRLDSEQDYLQQNIGDFANDRMIEDLTRRNARVFALAPVHQAYLDREVLVYWHSSLADRIVNLLALAHDSPGMTAASDMRILKAQLDPEEFVRKSSLPVDVRRAAAAFIRRSGYHYILVSTEKGAFSRIGKDLLEHPVEWGVEPAGRNGDVWLLYISGGPA